MKTTNSRIIVKGKENTHFSYCKIVIPKTELSCTQGADSVYKWINTDWKPCLELRSMYPRIDGKNEEFTLMFP